MANGSLKDEAAYFGDNAAYTGESGSKTNMWVIEDVYDFVTALNPSNKLNCNIYLRLVNNIDFNDHSFYRNGIDSTLYIKNDYYLYGDNHKIKNLVSLNANSHILKFQYVEKVDFTNVVAIHTGRFPILMATADNCDFGIFISNSAINIAMANVDVKITNCTFNIKGKSTGVNVIHAYNTIFQACHFNFDISANFDSYGRVFDSANSSTINTYINCYFTGKINSSGGITYFSNFSNFINSYFAIEWTGQDYDYGQNASNFSVCFVDKELFNKNGDYWRTIDGVSELTTAQAQNPDYLNSIGFLVGSVE